MLSKTAITWTPITKNFNSFIQVFLNIYTVFDNQNHVLHLNGFSKK